MKIIPFFWNYIYGTIYLILLLSFLTTLIHSHFCNFIFDSLKWKIIPNITFIHRNYEISIAQNEIILEDSLFNIFSNPEPIYFNSIERINFIGKHSIISNSGGIIFNVKMGNNNYFIVFSLLLILKSSSKSFKKDIRLLFY